MNFKVTLKDPDGLYAGVEEAVRESLEGFTFSSELESESIYDTRRETFNAEIRNWVRYGEYITIEFDTTAGTATVIPIR